MKRSLHFEKNLQTFYFTTGSHIFCTCILYFIRQVGLNYLAINITIIYGQKIFRQVCFEQWVLRLSKVGYEKSILKSNSCLVCPKWKKNLSELWDCEHLSNLMKIRFVYIGPIFLQMTPIPVQVKNFEPEPGTFLTGGSC